MKALLPRVAPGKGPGNHVVASGVESELEAVAAVALAVGLENEGRSHAALRLAPVNANFVSRHDRYWCFGC